MKTLDKIYTILVAFAGAREDERSSFVEHHTLHPDCREWRFQGKLGFGGKYRRESKSVDYYHEDQTAERDAIAARTNLELAQP